MTRVLFLTVRLMNFSLNYISLRLLTLSCKLKRLNVSHP